MSQKAAIIGGGITGLATAYYLLKKGCQVTVYEKEAQAGGLAATFPIEDSRLEKFYHHFFAQDALALDLLDELGIKDRFFWYYPRMGFYLDGRTYPFTSPLDLMRFRPLRFAERLKFGLFALKVKGRKDWLPLEGMTARDWLIKNLGDNVYEKVWRPLLKGKFGALADEIPASFVWFRLKARGQTRTRLGSREKLGYLKGSDQVLLAALVDRIIKLGGEIKLNSGSTALPAPAFDLTVVTTPNAYSFPKIKYLGNICVVFKLKNRFGDYYWTNIGEAGLPFCALVEHTNAVRDKGYNGFKILYASNYLEHRHPFWGMPDREIYEKYLEGLKTIKPDFSAAEVAEYFIWRERFAQPVPTLGHSRKIPPFKISDKLYYVANAQIYPQDRGINDSLKLVCKFVEQLPL